MARWRRRRRIVLAGVVTLLACSASAAAFPLRPDDAPPSAPAPGSPPGRALPAAPAPGSSRSPSTGQWDWPLEPAPAVVRRFEPSPTPWGAGHRGVDLSARVGQTVLAPADGVISFAGVIAGRGVVVVTHAGQLRTTYEPVHGLGAVVAPTGTPVSRGSPIGVVEATPGHCAPETCLHWGLLRGTGPDAAYLDPLSMIASAWDPPLLLPWRSPPGDAASWGMGVPAPGG